MEIVFNAERDLNKHIIRDKDGNIKEFRNKQGVRFPLFPYSTKMEPSLAKVLRTDLRNFDAVIGECFRLIQQKGFSKELKDSETYKEKLKKSTLETIANKTESEEEHEEKLKAIVEALFFNEGNLIKYSTKALSYMNWSKYHFGLKNKAAFIKSIFFDSNADIDLSCLDESEEQDHLFHRLMSESLPELETVSNDKSNFIVMDQKVTDLFRKDFEFLAKDKKAFLKDVEKLIKYYYFFYISRTVFKLNDFFKSNDHELFFTLENETFSESRKAYDAGWKQLSLKLESLFSHAICLDLVNHIFKEGEYDYIGLKQCYEEASNEQKKQLIEAIQGITNVYMEYVPEPEYNGGWKNFDEKFNQKLKGIKADNDLETAVIKLWYAIEFQFINSSRHKPRKNYANWFTFFSIENFLKNRGRNGYSLNLSHDMLLFLTKLCIGDKPKIRLKDLWSAFHLRGISFDDTSRQSIIDFFEKINLIEKKSDSGDAQYVKSIL